MCDREREIERKGFVYIERKELKKQFFRMGHPISGKPHVSRSNQTEKERERRTKIEESVCFVKVCVIKIKSESE
jgi:hypothetical protein